MADKPVLMENTKIGSFTRYDEGVFKRNSRFFRKVYMEDVTPDMCRSAGIAIPERLKAASAKPATGVVEEKAPDVDDTPAEDDTPAVDDTQGAPDFKEWDEDTLRKFCQDNDIPTHPAAKSTGLQAAITRFYEEAGSSEDA